ncbi:MAG: hypothetical protein RJA49_3076 [Actinomycetota bacterium]|jgi:hypothetical protein
MKYAIKYDTLGAAVATPLLAGRKHSGLEITDTDVVVRLGWMFIGTVPRAAVTGVRRKPGSVISRGAHGWNGRWLVNGAGNDLVVIDIDPAAKARVTGIPVHLRELTVSVEDPDGLVAALS